MNYLMDLRKTVGSRPLIACGAGVAIINHQNKILLQKRADNDCWGFIGGMLELGESIEEAVKREVYEEIGVKLLTISFFKVYSGKDFYYKYPNGDEVYNVINLFTYRGYMTESQLNANNNEVKEARFFSVGELPENISPPDIPIIKDIIKLIQK